MREYNTGISHIALSDTLFISDLDGTLLSPSAEFSRYTAEKLNSLILNGVNISVATARTAATVLKMAEGINFSIPIILMNGVCVYDTVHKKYVRIEYISDALLYSAIEIIKKYKLSGFIYCTDDTVSNSRLAVYYENTESPNAAQFIEERSRKYGKVFTRTHSFDVCLGHGAMYYSVSDVYEKLSDAYSAFSAVNGLRVEFYRDIYNENFWYLEVCAFAASKYNALMWLKSTYNFSHVIGFGDNLNDLPMFDACDIKCAVANARDEVKAHADYIIDSNFNDGVVKWIENHIVT